MNKTKTNKTKTQILFIPCYANISLEKQEKIRILSALKDFKCVGIISIVQYVNELYKIKKFLEEENFRVFIGGKILGCDVSNAVKIKDKVDVFLYIGSGKFHPVNAASSTEKKTLVYDPGTGSLTEITKEEVELFKRKKIASIIKSLNAQIYGILVSFKDHQFKIEQAIELKKKIEEKNKKAYIFVGNEINYSNLIAFNVDVWINTACPRIVEDNLGRPVINAEELNYFYLY